jgi:CRP-like cAMP-binding protein
MTAGGLDKKNIEAGELIFMEGEPGTEAYLIQSGKVEILKRDKDGMFGPVATLGPGQLFGEMAMAEERERPNGARALEDCVLITVSRAVIEEKLKGAEPFVGALYRILAGNLASTLDRNSAEAEKRKKPTPPKEAAADLDALSEVK